MSKFLGPAPRQEGITPEEASWRNQLWLVINALQKGYGVPQYASAPPYVKGALYFDTTLNKLRIGGATAWETVTSS